MVRSENADIKQKQDPARLTIQHCQLVIVNTHAPMLHPSEIKDSPLTQVCSRGFTILPHMYSHTLPASHSHTLPASHSHTLTLSRPHTLTLSRPHTLTLPASHSHTLPTSHSHTPDLTLSHSPDLTLSHSRPHTLTLPASHSPGLTLSRPHTHTLPASHSHTLPGNSRGTPLVILEGILNKIHSPFCRNIPLRQWHKTFPG